MRAGTLRHRVEIKSPTRTTDSQGGYTTTWSHVVDTWADIRPITAREAFVRQGLQHVVTHMVRMRYRDDMSSDYRIVWGSRTLLIRSMRNVDERGRMIEFECEEET